MNSGNFIGRRVTRKQAIMIGIVIMLFPLCAVVSVGYRVYDDYFRRDPTSTAQVGEGTQTPEDASDETPAEIEDLTLTQTESPTEKITATTIASPTLPPGGAAACVSASTQRQVGEVIQVFDGDMIMVRIGDDDALVRYIGIDAPGLDDPFGEEASDANRDLVSGEQVTLVRDVTNFDSEGNLLRYVFVGDIFVNNELVRLGYAEAVDPGPDSACSDLFQSTEDSARSKNVGIWEPQSELTSTLEPLWTDTPSPLIGKCTCDGEDNLECDDFRTWIDATQCFLKCNRRGKGDFYNLDPDGDNIACN